MSFKHTEWFSLYKIQKKIISQARKLSNPYKWEASPSVLSFSWTSRSKLDTNCVFNSSFQSLLKALFTPTVICSVTLKMYKHTSEGLHVMYFINSGQGLLQVHVHYLHIFF